MADGHFSQENLERFLRSELARGENRELVRHLLRRCSRCSRLLLQAARAQSLTFLVRSTAGAKEARGPGGLAIASASDLRGRMPWTRISTG
jgi:hypothetical protein